VAAPAVVAGQQPGHDGEWVATSFTPLTFSWPRTAWLESGFEATGRPVAFLLIGGDGGATAAFPPPDAAMTATPASSPSVKVAAIAMMDSKIDST